MQVTLHSQFPQSRLPFLHLVITKEKFDSFLALCIDDTLTVESLNTLNHISCEWLDHRFVFLYIYNQERKAMTLISLVLIRGDTQYCDAIISPWSWNISVSKFTASVSHARSSLSIIPNANNCSPSALYGDQLFVVTKTLFNKLYIISAKIYLNSRTIWYSLAYLICQ